jgi:hypothetical protein
MSKLHMIDIPVSKLRYPEIVHVSSCFHGFLPKHIRGTRSGSPVPLQWWPVRVHCAPIAAASQGPDQPMEVLKKHQRIPCSKCSKAEKAVGIPQNSGSVCSCTVLNANHSCTIHGQDDQSLCCSWVHPYPANILNFALLGHEASMYVMPYRCV